MSLFINTPTETLAECLEEKNPLSTQCTYSSWLLTNNVLYIPIMFILLINHLMLAGKNKMAESSETTDRSNSAQESDELDHIDTATDTGKYGNMPFI